MTTRLGVLVGVVAMIGAACSSTSPSVGQLPANAPARAAVTFTDWPTYHRDAARTGYDPGTPAISTLASAWTRTLDGGVYAEPLVVNGLLIAATENDTVYGLNPSTGAIQWQQHLGSPVPLSRLPCGNINPLGITGTPVYDSSSGHLFVAAELGGSSSSIKHTLFSLNPATGALVGSRSIDVSGYDPVVHQERAALAVAKGRVYVAFGGLFGDCGNYHGHVVASRTDLTGRLLLYSPTQYSSSAVRGGIWASSGPAVDPSGHLFVAVGNGTTTTTYDYSDSVLALGQRLRLADYFAPSTWRTDNAADLDLGSQGPALVGGYVYADGKSGTAYLLGPTSLGHIGGQTDSATVCASYGGTAVVGTTVYVPCTDGIRAVDVNGGTINVLWHAAATTAKGPPVVGGGAVWSLGIDNGVLYAINPSTGATMASLAVGSVEHFATPTLSGGYAFVPRTNGVMAVSGV